MRMLCQIQHIFAAIQQSQNNGRRSSKRKRKRGQSEDIMYESNRNNKSMSIDEISNYHLADDRLETPPKKKRKLNEKLSSKKHKKNKKKKKKEKVEKEKIEKTQYEF